MERLKNMKETLMSATQAQLSNLPNADCKELGEAVDMIKDLSEAIYYCTIVKAMEEEPKEDMRYYTPSSRAYYRDMDMGQGKMYYTEPFNHNYPVNSNNYPIKSPDYRDPMMRQDMGRDMMRDPREGRSQYSRKNYIESKEMHKHQDEKMKELEQYMKELSMDITEMIKDSSAQEKDMLKDKLKMLMEKI